MKVFASSPLYVAVSLGRPGWSAGLLYGLMVIVGTWVSLMIFVPAVADTTLRRMHLANSSFPVFAVQQISPAMYNFSNEGWAVGEDLSLAQWSLLNTDHLHYFNHFPVRNLTWLERENIGPAGLWGYYCSRFRGRELHSKYRLETVAEGGWNVVLLDSKFSDDLR